MAGCVSQLSSNEIMFLSGKGGGTISSVHAV